MPNRGDIARTAATIRGRKFPFRKLTDRDASYFEFLSDLIDRHGGSVTLEQIADSREYPKYIGSNKSYDAGVITRLSKAGWIAISSDGRTLTNMRKVESDGAEREVIRQRHLGKVASRPGQKEFSRKIRKAYESRCAITECSTDEAIEAAHIRTDDGRDFNDVSNGILLRADIHALFDAGLITLTMNGTALEVSADLKDTSYNFLRNVGVRRPVKGAPSPENILHHRNRFKSP